MLSGIGPKEELERLSIPVSAEAPAGRDLHDHFGVYQWWKLRDPDKHPAIGTPKWQDLEMFAGTPCDWVVTQQVDAQKLRRAFEKDADREPQDEHHMFSPGLAHTETVVAYAPARAQISGVEVPMDGTHCHGLTRHDTNLEGYCYAC